MAGAIDIGPHDPAELTIRLFAGLPFTSWSMRRSDGVAWPAAPYLAWPGGIKWESQLSSDATIAIITVSSVQVDAVRAAWPLADDPRVVLTDGFTLYAETNQPLFMEGIPA